MREGFRRPDGIDMVVYEGEKGEKRKCCEGQERGADHHAAMSLSHCNGSRS